MTTATAPPVGNGASISLRVGVLALQGSFREHMTLLRSVPGVTVLEVRTAEELHSCAGLIIPGGESTTMAHVAERWGLVPELRAFAAAGKPIWGTCAGMIFLADRADGMKQGGQTLVGGLDISVSRNFFGAQVNSFETQLSVPECFKPYGGEPTFRALFIRAPAVLSAGVGVHTLASYTLTAEEAAAQGRASVAVAVRSGVLLATAFHPELTTDSRWHRLFVDMVRENYKGGCESTGIAIVSLVPDAYASVRNRPNDVPIYGKEFMKVEAYTQPTTTAKQA
ncbi:hypothetical protein FOA52_014399 [Chlamydomonas sp. UWO 241]|nr:hypothetical protein FOA52_014399 [Chlamydomonas sp. UWO 241]